MVETCWTGKFASTVKFMVGMLSSNDLILNPQSIHWFTCATCVVMRGSNGVVTQKPGFPGSKRSIMMNPYMNLHLWKPQDHPELWSQKRWSKTQGFWERMCDALGTLKAFEHQLTDTSKYIAWTRVCFSIPVSRSRKPRAGRNQLLIRTLGHACSSSSKCGKSKACGQLYSLTGILHGFAGNLPQTFPGKEMQVYFL